MAKNFRAQISDFLKSTSTSVRDLEGIRKRAKLSVQAFADYLPVSAQTYRKYLETREFPNTAGMMEKRRRKASRVRVAPPSISSQKALQNQGVSEVGSQPALPLWKRVPADSLTRSRERQANRNWLTFDLKELHKPKPGDDYQHCECSVCAREVK